VNDENTKEKNSSVHAVIEILLGLVVLTSVMLNLYDLGLFLAIFGAFGLTLIFQGTLLLAIGILRSGSAFLNGFSDLPQKVNASTSLLIVSAALIILYFQIFLTGNQWLHLLFGIGLLGYGIGRIIFRGLTSGLNSVLRALITLLGLIITVFSIIVISFPIVQIYSHAGVTVSFTYTYFVDIAFILIGIDSLASAIAGILLTMFRTQRG
jgi:hypothetical protein